MTRTSNNLAKVRRTGLNSFGEPFTGNAIRGVVNRRSFSGGSGPLSMRKAQPMGEAAAMEKEAAAEASARQMAREAGRARAQAETQQAAPAAGQTGQLVPASRGGVKWEGAGESAPKPAPQPAGWFQGLMDRGQQALLTAARRQRGITAAADRKKGRAKAYRERV